MVSILLDKHLTQTVIGGIIRKILDSVQNIHGEPDSMTISIRLEPLSCLRDSPTEVVALLTINTDTEDIIGDDDGN